MSSDTILVTGFPGLRARALSAALLAGDRDARVTVLVHPNRRADSDSSLSILLSADLLMMRIFDAASIYLGLICADYR